ncbi:MAG: CYTH domain-containing protein [Victivallales bacterium]|nr:CYTH domain-containing protein [Victivallales bacterium]
MAMEIERKFLVKNDSWRDNCTRKQQLRQGYLAAAENCTVRVRVSDTEGWLSIKGPTVNISRSEFEYVISRADAEILLAEFAAGRQVEKIRYFVRYRETEWVVDEFIGSNRGLIVAEVELASETAAYDKPSWLGCEVSRDRRYRNSHLARHPYSEWNNSCIKY